jgi:hypothetical protein
MLTAVVGLGILAGRGLGYEEAVLRLAEVCVLYPSLGITLIITVYSGYAYFAKNRGLLSAG